MKRPTAHSQAMGLQRAIGGLARLQPRHDAVGNIAYLAKLVLNPAFYSGSTFLPHASLRRKLRGLRASLFYSSAVL